MKMIKRLILILVLASVLGAGGLWLYQGFLAPQTVVADAGFTQVIAVRTGDLSATISVVGELYAVQQEDLSFERMDGTDALLTLEVETGNKVKAGQTLATIDWLPYQQALDQAESALQEAEILLADLQEPATELDIAQADLAVAQAQLDLAQAKEALADLEAPDLGDYEAAVTDAQASLALAQLDQALAEHGSLAKSERDLAYALQWHERKVWELQDLVAKGEANLEQTEELAKEQELVSETQADLARVQAQRQVSLDAAVAEVATVQVKLADAQEALAEARAGGDALDRSQSELVVRQAEVTLDAAEQSRQALDEGPDAVDLAAAQADLDKQQLAVSEAKLDLAGAVLTASFDGTVLETNADLGDLITANCVVLSIANLDHLEVLTSVDETTIRQVAQGQAVEITFDAYPEQTFTGQVGEVPLQGSLQGGITVYQVPVSLEGAEALPLLVGMTANVEIQVGQVEDALLVPTMALQTLNGMYQVLVPDTDPESAAVAVPVEVGLSDGVYTQITRGLNAGDQVVVQLEDASSANFGMMDMGMIGGAMSGGGRPSGQ